jgi:hypothetical protein
MNANELSAIAENLSALASQIDIVIGQTRGAELLVVDSNLRAALSRVYNASEYVRAMQREQRDEAGHD